jgi:hypothetical protein
MVPGIKTACRAYASREMPDPSRTGFGHIESCLTARRSVASSAAKRSRLSLLRVVTNFT